MIVATSVLPACWSQARIADIAVINPGINKTSIEDDLAVSFVPMQAVGAGDGKVDVSTERTFREVKKGYTPFQEGDLIFAKITPCMENGKIAIVPLLRNGLGFGSTEFHVLRPSNGMSGRYLYYYISSQTFRNEAEHNMTGAVGQRRVPTNFLIEHRLPIPPSEEQQRIVAKIEELFSEVDKGTESLRSAHQQLAVYRQALLSYAFEGKLTADWRSSHKPLPACELKKGIQTDLEGCNKRSIEKWQAAVELWETSGRKGKRPLKPRPLRAASEIDAAELVGLPTLPEGWIWVRLGELVWSVKDGPHFSPKYSSEGIPFISGGNIRPDGIDFSTAKYISPQLHRTLSERCKPEKGDLLYTKGGTTGIARVNDYDEEFNVWVHVAVLKIIPSIRPFYLQHALNSPRCYAQSQKYTHGVGNQDLGLTRMVNIVLPICGWEEQECIENLISQAEAELITIKMALENELKRSDVLKQSVLRAAFSGKLVSQESGDEPASVLLERIRAEREAKSGKLKKTPQHTKGEAA